MTRKQRVEADRNAAHEALTQIVAEGPAQEKFGGFWLTRKQFEYALVLLQRKEKHETTT